ncbi:MULTISPECIES: Swt1 family HEPN domain-containing protein [Aurantimonas]|uniref:Swt1 family HEPN domain-containing protein n=1 Tax=Aurantimonas TaxID=182269 RepID=UPI003518984B
MRSEDSIKLFGLNNLTIEAEIRQIERSHSVDLGHSKDTEKKIDQTYYPQFTERLRSEATRMSTNYAIFYCLENSIREMISQRLYEQHGEEWWSIAVPEDVKKNAEGSRKREISSGITPRSSDIIDFTNFGELGEIIKVNWGIFGEMFRDLRAVERILATLNTLRAPIAHCKSLAEDEELRLHLGLRDWFRQMG